MNESCLNRRCEKAKQSLISRLDTSRYNTQKLLSYKFDIILILTGGGPLDKTTTLPVFVFFEAFFIE